MVFSTLMKTLLGAADCNFGKSCERFQQNYDLLWFNNLFCPQIIPFTQELHVINSNHSQETFAKNSLDTLPSLVSHKTTQKKNITLVLDLDETLVHSSSMPCNADFAFTVFTDREKTVYVRKRPYLEKFLEKVSEMFEVVIFTASQSAYSAKLLDILDPHNKVFARRMYRESCKWIDGRCFKDLTLLGIDLAKVFIIDNTPGVFRFHVHNGIPIKSWYCDPTDHALLHLLPFLEKLVDVDDVRPIIAAKYGKGINCEYSSLSPPQTIRI
ncbi:hypothetical protein PHAVU_004G152900 [Phaseolus vulgaris]|uniref:FCP1 homology domain-containing protein n=2 Tax=Phaseolus vulgaris TaxID=3885 RepID=V7C733_PHAVU|nr:hypothetical protein PHAVU_004G152900g [Phaseolus vulgaris]ESW24706.1 hypothetical protein PHAVU_004G152900g [Phaseolus vulgaris]